MLIILLICNIIKSFLPNYLSRFLNEENNVTYSYETIENIEYLVIDYLLLSGNQNFYKEKLYIDIKNKKPFKAIIYDKNNAETKCINHNFNSNDNKILFRDLREKD